MGKAFNPKDEANSTTSRPTHALTAAGSRKWYRDSEPGTRPYAQDLNFIIAQFREAMDEFGVTDTEGDDEILTKTIKAAFGQISAPNIIANGDFWYWPSGAGPFASSQFIAGNWLITPGTGSTNAWSRTGGLTARYALLWDRTVTGSAASILSQKSFNLRRFGGRKVTLSFMGFCFSGTVGITTRAQLIYGTGGSPTANDNSLQQTVTLTTTPTRHSVTFTIPSFSGISWGTNLDDCLNLQIFRGTAQANGFIALEDIKVEVNDVATSFIGNDRAEDLATIQHQIAVFVAQSENGTRWISFPMPMRKVPSVSLSAGSAANITEDGFNLTHTSSAAITITADAIT